MAIILSEAIELRRRYSEVYNCSRYDLPGFFKDHGFKVGAEIGVFAGDFTEKFCEVGLKMYAIDAWIKFPEVIEMTQRKLERGYEAAKQRLAPYDCTIIKKTSMEAVVDFEENSLDFVYIDANHSFKYIAEDIWEWSKRVRPGGVVSGHDYMRMKGKEHHYHVTYVVDAYAAAMKHHLYILGRRDKVEGEIRDPIRSWMWFK